MWLMTTLVIVSGGRWAGSVVVSGLSSLMPRA
jgi:hypothetical protein